MKLYQKYIIRVYLAFFFRMTPFLSAVLIAVQTLNIAGDLADESIVTIQDVAAVSFHIIPYILYSIIPFAVGISIVLTINQLLSTSQIVILKNAGISNIKLFKTFSIVGICIFLFMLLTSFFILPKTTQIRNEVQNSIIKSKIKNFIIPNSIKKLENITIVTSPYNSLKHIPITFIHQETETGDFIFVGNIQEAWSNSKMLGIDANNATILTTNRDSEDLIKFQTLETQINFFANEEKETYLKHLNIISLIREYNSTANTDCIKELNKRIIPALSVLLIMFALVTLMIKFHRNRAGYKITHIIVMSLILIYIIFISEKINNAFHTPSNFWLVYANTLLTFAFIYLINKKEFLYKKHV